MAAPRKLLEKQQELKEAAEKVTETETSTTEPKVETPVVEPVITEPVKPAETVPVATQVTPEKPKTDDDPNSETYAQRWRTAQGILDRQKKDIKTYQEENSKLQQSVKELLDSIGSVQAKAATPEPTATPIVHQESFSDDEEEILGGIGADSVMASAVRKLARQEFGAIASSIESRIKAVEDALRSEFAGVKTQVENVAQKSEQQLRAEFNQKVAGRLSNCFEIAESEEFSEWLNQKIDRRTKIKYSDIYGFAVKESMDVDTVIDLMKEFMNETGLYRESKPVATVQNTVARATEPVSSVVANANIPEALRDQIAPPRTNVSDVPGDSQSYIPITLDEVIHLSEVYMKNRTPENEKAYNDAKVKYYQTQQAIEASKGKK